MALTQKLQARLSQKLILTPSLQQAIKLLPMSTLELGELLTQEVVDNPLLEETPADEIQQTDSNNQTDKSDNESEAVNEKKDSWDDADYEYFFGDYLDEGYRPRVSREIRDLPPIENTLSNVSSLSDHLTWQLSLIGDEELDREIGLAIIGNLDADGYLVASIDEIAVMGNWKSEEVSRALEIIQSLDPVGVAARDLRECLLLQLKHLGMENTPSEAIVKDHISLLHKHQIAELAKCLSLEMMVVKEHVDIICRLDPKPGNRHTPSQSQYVIPDVYVAKSEEAYVAMLNEEGLPQLRISPVYRRMLDKSNKNNDETRSYVKDKFRSALWLIKSVDQRQKTIHKVATSIIKFQSDFLDRGIDHLRPLVLRDVADDIGMHESTGSRVVSNKYIHTPQGLFEMKYFFHSSIHNSHGKDISSLTIKKRLKKIIEQEDTGKPLSDSRIVAMLKSEGVVMARRTIAKYREELRIPTSNQRKVLY